MISGSPPAIANWIQEGDKWVAERVKIINQTEVEQFK
jgi:hypothetical protein